MEGDLGEIELAAGLDRALRGSLPCITCGYDLRGISIRAVCPECGTAVRAAILYQVDPEAEEFQPLRSPRATAAGLVAWSGAGLGAILAVWWLRLTDVLQEWTGWSVPYAWAPWIALLLGILSGLSVATLVRPTRGAHKRETLAALLGWMAYLPLIWAFWQIQMIDAAAPRPYLRSMVMPERIWFRLVMDAMLVVIFLGLRPNLRGLVRRSLAMRTGRVDRQTLLAMVGAVIVAAAGDLIRLLSEGAGEHIGELWRGIGSILVLMGSLFLTLGMITGVIDSWRIGRVILMPAPTLRQVLEGEDGAGAKAKG